MKTIGYCRVSTDEQAREGLSLDAQREKIRLYCELNGLELVDVISDEGISGKSIAARPGLQRVISMVQSKSIEGIVVYSLSRLARNTSECLDLSRQFERRGVSLHSTTEKLDTSSAMGKFFFTLLASFAEMERNLTGERTSAVLRHKKKNGEIYNARPLYGYRHQDGRLVPDESEQRIIVKILHLHDQRASFRGIATALNRRGVRTRCGNLWTGKQVQRVVMAASDRAALTAAVRV